jgi:hypothetical protein
MRSCVVPFRACEQYIKDLPSAFSSSSNSYSSFLQSIHLLIFLAHPCLIPSTAMTSEYQTSYVSPLPLNVSWNIAKQASCDKLMLKILPSVFASIEILEGGVGAGTVRLVTFGEGNSFFTCIKRGALYLLCIRTFRDAINLESVHGHVLSIEI